MGVTAARLATSEKWFHAVVYRQGLVQAAPIKDIMGPARRVDKQHRWVDFIQELGSFI
jgi:hypothetical protein